MQFSKSRFRSAIAFSSAVFLGSVSGAASAAAFVLTGGTFSQNFNAAASSGDNAAVPNGFSFSEKGANANQQFVAGTGSSNTGDTFSFGAAGGNERAFGGLRSGGLIPLFGFSFHNATGRAINGLDISFVGEQFRPGATGRADRLDFQFAIGTDSIDGPGFADFNALDFSSPSTVGAAGARDGNAAGFRTSLAASLANISVADGQNFTLRFQDFDADGADDGLAIDDFSLTPLFASVSAVPEPRSWGMMLVGFGFVGAALRRSKTRVAFAG